MKLRLILSIALAIALVAPAIAVADGPGTQVVREANETIGKLLKQTVAPGSAAERKLAEQVTRSVRGFLDVGMLAERAMVDHWASLSKAQQTEFLTLLRTLIEGNYIRGLRANLDYQVVYTGENKRDGDLVVTTQVKTKRRGRPYTVSIDYVLRRENGAWRAFDILTDGVGLVENYRAQFNKIIDKHGFDGLLERMKKKAAKMAETSGS